MEVGRQPAYLFRGDVYVPRIRAAIQAPLALEFVQVLAITHSLLATRVLTALPSALPFVSSMTNFITFPMSALD